MLKKVLYPTIAFMTLVSMSAYGFLEEEETKIEEEIKEIINEIFVCDGDIVEEPVKLPADLDEALACYLEGEDEVENDKDKEIIPVV